MGSDLRGIDVRGGVGSDVGESINMWAVISGRVSACGDMVCGYCLQRLSGWVVRVSGREAEPAGFPLCCAGSWVNN